MATRAFLERDGTRLAVHDHGDDGPDVVLLHGLAGYAGSGRRRRGGCGERARVVALDARGHGDSERAPRDVSRRVAVEDVAFAIERLGLAPAVVVGQSLGGHTALLVAAARADLVRGLVVVEASPAGGGPDAAAELRTALARWPVPFASRAAAVAFFGGGMGAHRVPDARRPRRGRHCGRGRCARDGRAPPGGAARGIADAGHDVHLERPAEWRAALTAFLDALDAGAG